MMSELADRLDKLISAGAMNKTGYQDNLAMMDVTGTKVSGSSLCQQISQPTDLSYAGATLGPYVLLLELPTKS